jgi:hypothetical protein
MQKAKPKANGMSKRRSLSKESAQVSKGNARAGMLKQLAWPTFVLVLLAFVVVFVIGLFLPGRLKKQADCGSAVAAIQYVCEGKITRFEDGVAELQTQGGERFIINPVAEGFRPPEIGSLQRVALVPFRRSADNVYLARIQTMRKINRYSSESAGES